MNTAAPTEAEIQSAPVVDRWQIHQSLSGTRYLQGWVKDHPGIAADDFATTSPIVQVDPASPPQWARTRSRVYRLASAAGPVESEIRALAHEAGLSPRAWDIKAYVAVIADWSGEQETEIDYVEQMLAHLFRHSDEDRDQARSLLAAYRKERAE